METKRGRKEKRLKRKESWSRKESKGERIRGRRIKASVKDGKEESGHILSLYLHDSWERVDGLKLFLALIQGLSEERENTES